MFKGLLRMVGTVIGGAAGLGAMYLTFLCGGLSYSNSHPQKVRQCRCLLSPASPRANSCVIPVDAMCTRKEL